MIITFIICTVHETVAYSYIRGQPFQRLSSKLAQQPEYAIFYFLDVLVAA